MINVIKAIALFMAIWWTLIIVAKLLHNEAIPSGNFILQTIGITGFVYLQWLI